MAIIKIVIVDDDKPLLQSLTFNLEAAGFEVMAYHSGSSAQIDIPELKPDCVLTDIQMPGFDGLSMIEELRSLPELSDTRFIVMSANDPEKWQSKSLVAGARAYFAKPLDLQSFLIELKKAILT